MKFKYIPRYKAYFVVHSHAITGDYIGCDIWSSPPWEQSVLPKNTVVGVYAEITGDTFAQANKMLWEDLANRVAYGFNGWKQLTRNWLHRNQEEFNALVEEQIKCRLKHLEQLIKSDKDCLPEQHISGNS